MLDVDGHVIRPDVLVERVQQLVSTIGGQSPPAPAAIQAVSTEQLAAPVHAMQPLLAELRPPDLSGATGLRGRIGRLFKRVIRRLTSWYVEPRWIIQEQFDVRNIEFSRQVIGAFDRTNRHLERVDGELEELRRQNIRLKLQIVAEIERHSRHRREIGEILKTVASQVDLQNLSRDVKRLGVTGSTSTDIDYVEFEDRCRGSSENVQHAQERYLALFPTASGSGAVIDIGCGRGEMLELFIAAGYKAIGVDMDTNMIELCRAKGLPVVQDDGIHYLETTEDNSLRGIFCAQVVEHLLTSELERLVELSYQKLMPSAVLLIETINPRSLFALGNHFFADVSHVRPVHPETLRFICEQIGFGKVELEERSPHPFMNTVDELPDGEVGTVLKELSQSVFGYQDYAIVATK
ncbi:MAG: class I SAM-dependent methyltransferase [Acidimicrobiales bacterium]